MARTVLGSDDMRRASSRWVRASPPRARVARRTNWSAVTPCGANAASDRRWRARYAARRAIARSCPVVIGGLAAWGIRAFTHDRGWEQCKASGRECASEKMMRVARAVTAGGSSGPRPCRPIRPAPLSVRGAAGPADPRSIPLTAWARPPRAVRLSALAASVPSPGGPNRPSAWRIGAARDMPINLPEPEPGRTPGCRRSKQATRQGRPLRDCRCRVLSEQVECVPRGGGGRCVSGWQRVVPGRRVASVLPL